MFRFRLFVSSGALLPAVRLQWCSLQLCMPKILKRGPWLLSSGHGGGAAADASSRDGLNEVQTWLLDEDACKTEWQTLLDMRARHAQ